MNESDIEQLKQQLLTLRSDLRRMEEASREAAMTAETDQAEGVSRRDAMQAHLLAQEPARRRQRQLGKIEGAFRRIETGEYGNCYMCSEEIDLQRLTADPTNTRCTQCVE